MMDFINPFNEATKDLRLLSGAALKAIQKYGQGLASQEYGWPA